MKQILVTWYEKVDNENLYFQVCPDKADADQFIKEIPLLGYKPDWTTLKRYSLVEIKNALAFGSTEGDSSLCL